MQVVGVDWAGKKWACVVFDGSSAHVVGLRTLREVVEAFADTTDCVGVDIPIGLPTDGAGRRADNEARKLVRASTVFQTFPRDIYGCGSHAEAVELCHSRGWPGPSRQSFGIWKCMREVEPFANDSFEVHPEVSFWQMNGRAKLGASKHTWNGFFERRALLEARGLHLPEGIAEELPPVDVLDAAAVAWTAWRIANNQHSTLPEHPEPGESTISY